MKQNLYKYIEAHAKESPNNLAIIFEKQSLTYLELFNQINNLIEYITYTLKAKEGDRIVILSMNRIEYFLLFYACAKLGTILTPLNWRLTSKEITHILKDVGAKYLFIEVGFENITKHLFKNINKLQIIKIGKLSKILKSINSIKKYTPELPKKSISNNNLPLLIIYTSGTTGKPKGAVLNQKAIYYNILNSIYMHEFSKTDHILTVIPLFHVGGLNIQSIPALHIGATLTIHKKFDIKNIFSALKKNIYTHTVFVPVILDSLLSQKLWHKDIFSSLKAITTGATIVSKELIKIYEKYNIPIIQVYGSTETAPIAICQKISVKRTPYGNTGKVAIHNTAKIFDKDHKEVRNNIVGEIGIKGKNLFSYYWKDPIKTKKAFSNNWFMTGDYGKKDKNDNFYIVGRKNNIIISGGENIYPSELEEVFNKEKYIIESAIIGVYDIKWEEVPVAFIKVKKQSLSDLSELKSALVIKLAKYKIPKKIFYLEEIPKNTLGKIDYKILKAYYIKLINEVKTKEKK